MRLPPWRVHSRHATLLARSSRSLEFEEPPPRTDDATLTYSATPERTGCLEVREINYAKDEGEFEKRARGTVGNGNEMMMLD
jgi:hypothetical protein